MIDNICNILTKKKIMRKKFWAAIALMMALGMGACGGDDDTIVTVDPQEEEPENKPDDEDDEDLSNTNNDWRPISLTRSEQQMVTGNNDFAFRLFRQLSSSDDYRYKSLVVSPMSITFCLGMLNNGATDQTQVQINSVLGFANTGADGINAFCRKMLSEAPTLDKLTKVHIANNIYLNDPKHTRHTLFPDFVKTVKDYYDATPEVRYFGDGMTCGVINQWCSDHTKGMIKEVVKEKDFEDPNLFLLLLNAIYFKGAWMHKFDADMTQTEDFEHAGPDKYQLMLPTMHQEEEFAYAENDLCQVLRMPYGNGAYAMTVLLPQQGKTIDQLLQTLTAESWQSNYRYLPPAIVDVKLPRFETGQTVDLIDAMKALGMTRAFKEFEAEFWNLSDFERMWISLMRQVARIKVSEQGAEAAAVTVIGVDGKEGAGPSHVTFHATRPFLYVISEQSTGSIFFIGKFTGN